MTNEKKYRIRMTKTFCRIKRDDQVFEREGTLDELTDMFGYTLEIGHSWNPKIQRRPQTIRRFVSDLQKSYGEKEGACYDRTSVELVTD